jgi:hypothetical protein
MASPNGKFYAGECYVVFGSANPSPYVNLSMLNGSNGFVVNGIDAYDYSFRVVSGIGDINGDGLDDIATGAYRADPNGVYNAGETYVIFGRQTNVSIDPLQESLPLEAFPNPASTTLTVRVPNLGHAPSLSVFDLLGREVAVDYNRTGEHLKLDIAALPKGSYVLRVQVDGDVGTARFVKK